MKTIHCKICGKDIEVYGWPSHVDMEKRRWGKDIYKKLNLGPLKGPLDTYLDNRKEEREKDKSG